MGFIKAKRMKHRFNQDLVREVTTVSFLVIVLANELAGSLMTSGQQRKSLDSTRPVLEGQAALDVTIVGVKMPRTKAHRNLSCSVVRILLTFDL